MTPRSAALLALLLVGCASKKPRADQLNLVRAAEPCPGPAGEVVVRVLDSPSLTGTDPVAFLREPAIHWIVALQIVETLEGDPIGERLGVLVHSPSMFAGEVWGYGASPRSDPATLELRWSAEYCLFEVTKTITPTVTRGADGGEFELTAPTVHSTIVE